MNLVGGIDPGVNGAAALYDADSGTLFGVYPLPNYTVQIGATERKRLDIDALWQLFEGFKLLGVKLIGIENVQGGNFKGKKQSAAGAFQFGYTFGVLTMAARAVGIEYVTPSPAVWKLTEKVPVATAGIIAKADAEFPDHKKHWHGPQGGSYHDPAEAAFLARYIATRILPTRGLQADETVRALAEATKTDLPASAETIAETQRKAARVRAAVGTSSAGKQSHKVRRGKK